MYKIMLTIGNALSASYPGFKAKLKWGKKYDLSESYDAWEKSLQEKDFSLSGRLEAGSWNKVELIVAPATAEQLGYVNLSLTTNTVILYQK